MTSSNEEPCESLNTRMMQNYHLVWLDRNIDENNDKWRDSIIQLREVVNTINTFSDVDQCIDFLIDTQEMAFIIMSEEFNKTVLSSILDMAQVRCIYIFCETKFQHENWSKNYPKVVGIYTDIKTIRTELKRAIQNHDHNIVFTNSNEQSDGSAKQNHNILDCSFMYTQMLKNILLNLDFNTEHFDDFLGYCRELYNGNCRELQRINQFEREYDGRQGIRWYTWQSFIYLMVNRALRQMDVQLIVKMGFFIRHLHNHINTL